MPIIVNMSASIFPFIFRSRALSVFNEGDKFISNSQGLKF